MLGNATGWLLIGVGMLWWAFVTWRERLKRRKIIENRPRFDDNEIYKQFYKNSGLAKEEILHVWHEVSSVLHIDPGKIRPYDQIIQFKPKVFLLLLSDFDDLNDWLSMLAQSSKLNPGKLDTIDDIVHFAIRCRDIVRRS